jgi:hypothetical protein
VFGLTAEDALSEFVALTVEVLELRGVDAAARTTALTRHIDNLLKKYVMDDERLLDPNGRSKGCKL